MSYKDFVSINTAFDKEEFYANEEVTGTISLRNNSPIDLDLENIHISLILKHRGKGETDSIVLNSLANHEYKQLSRGQTITITFSFPPVYNVTFNGQNVSQSILIKTKVDIAEESEKQLRNDKLSNFKLGGYVRGLFSPDFYNETPVVIAKGDSCYQVQNAIGTIQPGIKKGNAILLTGLIVTIILGVILYINTKNTDILIALICVYGLLTIGVYYYKIGPSKSAGSIDFKLVNQKDDSYEIHLKFEKPTVNIQEINCQLIGQEKVTYDNGSSRSTARNYFYKGELNRILPQGSSTINQVSFPKKSLPTSINNNDFDILWYFRIIVLTRNNITIKGQHIIDLKYQKVLD